MAAIKMELMELETTGQYLDIYQQHVYYFHH